MKPVEAILTIYLAAAISTMRVDQIAQRSEVNHIVTTCTTNMVNLVALGHQECQGDQLRKKDGTGKFQKKWVHLDQFRHEN